MAAVVGVAAFSVPLSAAATLALIPTALLVFALSYLMGWTGLSILVICIGMLELVLAGMMSATVGLVLVAAAILVSAPRPRYDLVVVILLLQTSIISTLEQLVSNWLFAYRVETTAAAVVATVALSIAGSVRSLVAASGVGAAVGFAWIGTHFGVAPYTTGLACGLVPALLAAIYGPNMRVTKWIPALGLSAAITLGAITWLANPPRMFSEAYVLLPKAEDAYEAKFFRNYANTLAFVGIRAREISSLIEVPRGAVLLLPWTTAPLGRVEESFVVDFHRLSKERDWLTVIAAEHTDLGSNAERTSRLVGRTLVRTDLTVPPDNRDTTGPMHALDLRGWPHDAVLNRGASVEVQRVSDKVLLSGDAWWAEPDRGEWLWVGDYIWQAGERTGRLALATAVRTDHGSFLVVGDNSPFINSQVIADPRPLFRLLELATLWPALVLDVTLIVSGCLLMLTRFGAYRAVLMGAAMLTPVIAMLLAHEISFKPSESWERINIGQSGFFPANFNVILAESIGLTESEWELRRNARPISGKISPPSGWVVLFTHIENDLTVGRTTIRNCRRLGALETSDGPRLMDAQACEVAGEGKVLLGDPGGASIVMSKHEGGTLILVLDTSFLAQTAPRANAQWLETQLSRRGRVHEDN